MARMSWLDPRCRQPFFRLIEHRLEHRRLVRTSRNKSDAGGVIDNGERKSDALRWRLGRVLDIRNPAIFLIDQLVFREQGRGVSVGPHSEQDKIKHGESRRVLAGKLPDQLLLVRIRKFVEIVQQFWVDGMNILLGDRHL